MARRRSSSLSLEHLPPAAGTDPVAAALAHYDAEGRKTGLVKLRIAAGLLSGGRATVATLPWTALRYPHLLALRQALLDVHYAPQTARTVLSVVRGVLREAWRLGQYPGDELQRIADVPVIHGVTETRAGRMLTVAEIRKLERSAGRDGLRGARDLAILGLLYGGALRRAEAARLAVADLRTPGMVRVIGKGGREAIQPLPAQARAWIARWLQVRGRWPGPLLCALSFHHGSMHLLHRGLRPNSAWLALAALGRRAGVPHFSPHDLRRSFVSHLLDAGVEVRVVQQLARHRQVTTTQRYDRRVLSSLASAAQRLPF